MRNNKAGIKTKTKTITLKTKARIPICPLCQSESKGEPKDADFASGLISFDTNNNFLKQYEALNP